MSQQTRHVNMDCMANISKANVSWLTPKCLTAQFKTSFRLLGASKTDSGVCACSDPELAAFLGIELSRGLTAKGLRQAEVEFYLWASCSLFPFVQIITDMRLGGVAFYKTGSSPTGVLSRALSEG